MLIVIFVVFVLLFLVSAFVDDEAFMFLGIIFGGFGVVITLIFICANLIGIIDGRTLEDRIALYEAENAAIEQDINTLVEQYMKYEADTYESLKGESGITLVSLYPELKADALVKEQCELYIANKEQITTMKEEQIKISSYKFWLYFGK